MKQLIGHEPNLCARSMLLGVEFVTLYISCATAYAHQRQQQQQQQQQQQWLEEACSRNLLHAKQ